MITQKQYPIPHSQIKNNTKSTLDTPILRKLGRLGKLGEKNPGVITGVE